MMTVHSILIACLASLFMQPAAAQQKEPNDESMQPSYHINHRALNPALNVEVALDGSVRYKEIRKRRQGIVLAYLDRMANTDLSDRPREQKLAYYINVYNATVVNEIVQRWHDDFQPSEKDWQMFKDKTVRLFAGKTISLNELEELIKQCKEPRALAALSKGVKSSPPLRPRAYEAEELDAMLDDQMRRFINDRSRNEVDRDNHKLKLAKFFENYADQFGGKDELPKYISKYLDADSVEGFTVEFKDEPDVLNAAPE